MNCGSTQQQQQHQFKPKQTISSTIAAVTKTPAEAVSLASASSSSSSSLAVNLNVTQNWSQNLERENLMLMIKNIETSTATCTEWDEKEKEENISLVQRRESVSEESCVVENNSLQDIFENNNASLSPLLSLKSQNTDLSEQSVTTTTTTTPPTTITTTTTASITSTNIESNDDATTGINTFTALPLEQETEKEKEPEQKSNRSQNSLNEISNDSPSVSNNTSATALHQSAEREISNKPPNRTPSPSISPHFNSLTLNVKGVIQKIPSDVKLTRDLLSSLGANSSKADEDSISKSSDTSGELIRGTISQDNSVQKSKSSSRLSERAKKKSWYNVLYPNYKSRSQDFKKLFPEVPSDERLIVDYSCALQRDILVQGRLYVSQNYVCFHANIFRWETYLSIKWKDVAAITKEKTALVIPNAISIATDKEKYFFATFATRDKTFLMLFRVWQNTLMNKQMLPQEMWQWVHNCYGDELGLTTDDEDYIDPTSVTNAEAEVDESDSEFVSAVDDISLQSKKEFLEEEELVGTESAAEEQTNLDTVESYKEFSINLNSSSGVVSLINSTACNSTVKGSIKKSIKNKNTSTSSSTTTTSGSDNKTSDNNSSADSKNQRPSSTKNKMKPNAKELTLISASPPEDGATGAPATPPTSGNTSQSAVNGGNSSGSGSNAPAKENKSSTVNSAGASYEGKRKVAKNNRQRDETSSKNSEQLPTDMSDSSDSDENKIPFVATAECDSTHEGRQLMHTILPINIETLFNLLFSKSKFLLDFHAMRKSTDMVFGDWGTNEEGQQERIVNVTVQIAASVGPKSSKVTEYQVLRECSKPGELYSVDINSVNAGIPYADSFSVLIHNCLVRTVDDHTMLSVHAQIKYKKSIWGVVKGFIEKNTWAGLEDFYTSLLHSLQSETNIPPAKGKGRRPRRGTAAQVRPLEENLPAIQAKPDAAIEKVLAPHSLTPKHQTASKELPGTAIGHHKWLSVFVVVLCLLLILLNVILLLKIWHMEGRIEEDYKSRTRMPNLAAMKQLPNTPQDWMELVRHQEILHETELKKWHKVLQTAIELLKKTEKTLAELLFR